MPRTVRIIAITVAFFGLVVAFGCSVALYVGGIVIDEQQVDPEFRLLPLFAGIAIGASTAVAGFGVWIAGYTPAAKTARRD